MSAEDLYHEAILDLDRAPRNEGRVDDPTHRAKVSNPLCGDRVELSLTLEDGRIREVRFVGRGCAISRASASLLTELAADRSPDEARALARALDGWLRSGGEPPLGLEALAPLRGVHAFPSRVRCATLAWEALETALAGPVGAR